MVKTIEVRKAGFINKGAELMLLATIQEARRRMPDVRIAVAPTVEHPFTERARLGIWHKAELRRKGVDLGRLVDRVPAKLRHRYGFVAADEIDVVFDAAGFAYSDQWGPDPLDDLVGRLKDWEQRKQKLVLLPQAFGPFENQHLQDCMKRVADSATLIFARDDKSYEHLVKAVGERDTIHQCPDFTNLLSPLTVLPDTPGVTLQRGAGNVAIVPNARMMDKTTQDSQHSYPSFLIRSIGLLQKAGLTPFFLLHTAGEDQKLAEQVNGQLSTPLPMVQAGGALEAKSIINQCDALIGSRFHALVNAMSQGVPAIGTGWSHKYRALFGDYDYAEGLSAVNLSDEDLHKALAPILTPASRTQVSGRLMTASNQLKQTVRGMWDDVYATVGLG